MPKCPICNSCTQYRWIGDSRFLWCDFCNIFYEFKNNHLIEVSKEDIEKIKELEYSKGNLDA